MIRFDISCISCNYLARLSSFSPPCSMCCPLSDPYIEAESSPEISDYVPREDHDLLFLYYNKFVLDMQKPSSFCLSQLHIVSRTMKPEQQQQQQHLSSLPPFCIGTHSGIARLTSDEYTHRHAPYSLFAKCPCNPPSKASRIDDGIDDTIHTYC